MKSIDFHIRGIAPLICHNAQLADPLNEYTKAVAEITSKRKKSDADHAEIARREYLGGFYLNSDGHPIMPGSNIERMFRDAAAKSKRGKDVQAGMIVPDDSLIIYDGPKSAEALWATKKFFLRSSCKVGGKRVIRTRPCFMGWEVEFKVIFDESILNPRAIEEFLDLAGKVVGLGDWRPKYGRFEVVS